MIFISNQEIRNLENGAFKKQIISLQSFLDEEDIFRYDFLQNATRKYHFASNAKYHHVTAILKEKMRTDRLFIRCFPLQLQRLLWIVLYKRETILNLMIIYMSIYSLYIIIFRLLVM